MNYVGYKYFDEAKTRRSADVLYMEKNEKLETFKKRCLNFGYEPVDKRNVIDRYKIMSDVLIKGDLNTRRFNFSIFLQNLAGDFNKASIIRNNNAFCGKEIIIFGDKDYDRRGTTGMHTYENFKHVSCLNDLGSLFENYDYVIGIDNVDGAKTIQEYNWNHEANTLLIFGEEGVGICPEILDQCHDILYIPQFGAVRSINVASAAAIVMYEYTRNFWNQI